MPLHCSRAAPAALAPFSPPRQEKQQREREARRPLPCVHPGAVPALTPLRAAAPSLQEKKQKEREARSGYRVEQQFNLEDFILPWASGGYGGAFTVHWWGGGECQVGLAGVCMQRMSPAGLRTRSVCLRARGKLVCHAPACLAPLPSVHKLIATCHRGCLPQTTRSEAAAATTVRAAALGCCGGCNRGFPLSLSHVPPFILRFTILVLIAPLRWHSTVVNTTPNGSAASTRGGLIRMHSSHLDIACSF